MPGLVAYGLAFNSGVTVTGAFITGNDFANNATGALLTSGATISGQIVGNNGYNPVGASALTPGASPWTYTAGLSPETVYISDTVGITALTQGGVSIIPVSTLANAILPVQLDPNASLVITYSGTLTGKKMVH